MKVAVIGAGISGLQVARALQKRDIKYTIFEAKAGPGGVWRTTSHGQGAQVPWENYQFPEFPWPLKFREAYPTAIFPPAKAILDYTELYIKHFHLSLHVEYATRVISVTRPTGTAASTGWTVVTEKGGDKTSRDFDFVVLASGSFTIPNYPDIKTSKNFKGKAILARDLTTENLGTAKAKHVVVIGSGKSAIDVAGAAAEVAASVILLARNAHFWLPLHVLGLVPFQYIGYTRLGVWLVSQPYPFSYSTSALNAFFHRVLAPTKRFIWSIMDKLLPWQFSLPAELIPSHRGVEQDVFGELGLLDGSHPFLQHLKGGKIHVVRGTPEAFTATGLKTHAGEELKADVVVYATGFVREYDFLPAKELAALKQTPEGIPLYRDIIPLDVPGLAFVGSEVVTFDAFTTNGLQAEWVAALLKEEFHLPPRKEMEADIERKQAWRHSLMPAHNFRAGRLGHVCMMLCDELLLDMGYKRFRKGWLFLKEVWQPYSSKDYREVFYRRPRPQHTIRGRANY